MSDHPFHGRKEWAERTPSWAPLGPVDDVFVHHDVFRYQEGFEPSTMRALENAEIARGGYIALAYHTLVTGDGSLVECRPGNVAGGATYKRNSSSRAIVLPGNYMERAPSEAQVDGIAEQVAVWVRAGLVRPSFRVYGHRDVFPTACPGDSIYGRLHGFGSVEAIAHAKLETSSTPITPGPPPPQLPNPPPGVPVDWGGLAAFAEALRQSIRKNPLSLATRATRPWETKLVQQRLVDLGYGLGAAGVDGDYGPATVRAVKGFQRAARIRQDGIVGRVTLARLGA